MGKQRIIHPPRPPRILHRIALSLLLALPVPSSPAQTPTVSATTVPLILPSAIVFDSTGNLYLAETASHLIRKVDTTGYITTIAGTGTQGFSGDNGPAVSAQLDSPQGLALDSSQNLYIADTHNHRIRKLSLATGTITTIAGASTPGFSGDNGPAISAHLNLPTSLAVDSSQSLYIADTQNHRIRKLTAATGIITTIAGTGTQGSSGDNGSALSASIDSPAGLAVDTAGNLYLADTHNHRIRKLTAATGTITTIAGTSFPGYSGDAASGTSADLTLPRGLTLDPSGNLYLADTQNHRIRRVDATSGIITTISGLSTQAFSGDNSAATTAALDTPRAVTLSPSGLVTIADTGNQRVRQVGPDATIRTIAGLGLTAPGTLALTGPSVIAYGTGHLTAILSSAPPATGTITFLDTVNASATTLGTATLATNSASLSTANLPAGRHIIVATFSGDPTHASAQSPALTLTVSPQPLTATINPARLLYGQPIPAFNATLTGVLPQDASSLATTFSTTAANLAPPGIYPITAVLSGPAAGNYTLTTSPSAITITPAPTLTTLTASTDTIAADLPVTLTSHVATTTSGTPTGTISLRDGAITLFTAEVPSTGDSAFTTSSLGAGIHTLTTLYTGDPNFSPSTSTPQLIGVGTSPNPNFIISTTGPATQTILSGNSATFTFAVQMQGTALSSPINLAASGLPNLATASFTPNYLPPGATPGTFTLTVTTPKTSALWRKSPLQPPSLALFLFPILGLALRSGRQTRSIHLLTLALTATSLILCLGCGDRIYTGSKSINTPSTYNITVTGTATTPAGASLSHAANVTLLIQPAS